MEAAGPAPERRSEHDRLDHRLEQVKRKEGCRREKRTSQQRRSNSLRFSGQPTDIGKKHDRHVHPAQPSVRGLSRDFAATCYTPTGVHAPNERWHLLVVLLMLASHTKQRQALLCPRKATSNSGRTRLLEWLKQSLSPGSVSTPPFPPVYNPRGRVWTWW